MIARAVAAGVPFAWLTADETYGQAKWLQAWLEERGPGQAGAGDASTRPGNATTGGAATHSPESSGCCLRSRMTVPVRECGHATGLETARGPAPGDLQTALLAQADAVLDGKSPSEEDRLLLTLAEPARAIWLLGWLDYEVSQGSLLACFYNSHGRHARLAAGVLRRMGASRMAGVVAEAAASHEHAFAEWAARRAELDALGEFAVVKLYAGLSNADDLVRLTDQYRQAADDEDWGSRLDAYLSEQVRLLTE